MTKKDKEESKYYIDKAVYEHVIPEKNIRQAFESIYHAGYYAGKNAAREEAQLLRESAQDQEQPIKKPLF